MTNYLVLLRHGESQWNLENRFTGFKDVELSENGIREAREAGKMLSAAGIAFNKVFSSTLKRANNTAELALKEAGQGALFGQMIRHDDLRERDYGDLTGLNKDETRAKYGDEQVHIWRRSFDTPPPNGEALKQTSERTIPFYEGCIYGDLKQGRNVLVVAHGNSNRSIVMALEKLSGEEIMKVELATGVPVVYEVALDGSVVSKRILE